MNTDRKNERDADRVIGTLMIVALAAIVEDAYTTAVAFGHVAMLAITMGVLALRIVHFWKRTVWHRFKKETVGER